MADWGCRIVEEQCRLAVATPSDFASLSHLPGREGFLNLPFRGLSAEWRGGGVGIKKSTKQQYNTGGNTLRLPLRGIHLLGGRGSPCFFTNSTE